MHEMGQEDPMRKRTVLVLVALLVGVASIPAQAATITFAGGPGGTVVYGGAGGPLTGTAIDISFITGADVPSPGVLTCDCELDFTTGANTSEGPIPPTWTFAGGGTFVISGDAFDGATLVASGDLLTGTFTASPSPPTVTGAGVLLLVNGFGVDTKDPDLLAHFGLSGSPAFSFANADIALSPTLTTEAFSGTVVSATVVNQSVPDGGSTIAALGLALVGLGMLRRRFPI
jgi:hypothetical protein